MNVAKLNPAIDALILQEVADKDIGLFKDVLERAIRDNLSIEQFKRTIVKTMLPHYKLHGYCRTYFTAKSLGQTCNRLCC